MSDFEKGVSVDSTSQRFDYTDFPVESNLNYRYESAEALLGNTEVLAEMISDHYENQVPRLEVLDEYYKAKNTNIKRNKRRKEKGKADHRPAHNFAKIGCQFDVGYNTGIPIKTEFTKEDEEDTTTDEANDILRDFNALNDVDGLNSELWLDFDKYGRAYELHYRTQDDEDRVFISNVFETFVVYDTTIERNPILAVRYPKMGFTNDNKKRVQPIVYTADEVITYQETTVPDVKLTEIDRKTHNYPSIQINEASPNRYRQALYEDVLSLIDLYDAAQADTANYMTDLNDAMLVISGDIRAAGMTTDDVIKQKDANLLLLESATDLNGNKTQVTAGYIYKQYDVQGSEAYKDRLVSDIHKLMNIPDLSDENFSGTQSGESMKYKLFGFDQMTATKQRLFDKFLRRRYELVFGLKKELNEIVEYNLNRLEIKFTPNLPQAIKDELDMLTKAGLDISQETLAGLASFIDNYAEEKRRLEEEDEPMPMYDFETPQEEPEDVEPAEEV